MIVEQIWTGNAYRNFNYVVACGETGEALAIDPLDYGKCLEVAERRGWTITQVPIQASLRHALDSINRQTAEAACIYERSRASGNRILHGVVTREGIEKFTLGRL